ncbi:uncharacterized protein [Miscanthus floridulus]|uniref:uncharacterized protein n=1 Tax=Miscanthus floridulus TaxID=154761 RepID=UPI003458607D
MPTGTRKLTALHTLGVVNVSASGTKSILEDLKNITQVSGINKSEKLFSAISVLVHLESLSVWLDKDSQGCLDDISLRLKSLGSLKLHGLGDKLPEWSGKHLTKLTKIDLEMTTVMKQPEETGTTENASSQGKKGVMMLLGMLPELCILRICAKQFQDGELIVKVIKNAIEDNSFEKVKVLEIACGSSAKVSFGNKAMKKLEQLKIDCSIGSKYEFAGLEHLPELKEVWLKGSYDDALKQDLQSQLDKHEKRPVLKLE